MGSASLFSTYFASDSSIVYLKVFDHVYDAVLFILVVYLVYLIDFVDFVVFVDGVFVFVFWYVCEYWPIPWSLS